MGIKKTLLFSAPIALLGVSTPFLLTSCTKVENNKLESKSLDVNAFEKNNAGIWNTSEMEGYSFGSFSISKTYFGIPIIDLKIIAAYNAIAPDSYSGNIYFKTYDDAINLVNFINKYDEIHVLSNDDYNNLLEGTKIYKELEGHTSFIANIGGDPLVYETDDTVSADLQLFVLNNFDDVFNKINS